METLELRDLKTDLSKLKAKLHRGDQRTLAGTLKSHPNRVSNAFDGFVSDVEFLVRLRTETQELIRNRKPSGKKVGKGKQENGITR